MARGATNAEIAATLFVSEPTVKSHVGSIFSKLAVRDRAAAIVFAYDHGIVDPRARLSLPTPPVGGDEESTVDRCARAVERARSTP